MNVHTHRNARQVSPGSGIGSLLGLLLLKCSKRDWRMALNRMVGRTLRVPCHFKYSLAKPAGCQFELEGVDGPVAAQGLKDMPRFPSPGVRTSAEHGLDSKERALLVCVEEFKDQPL